MKRILALTLIFALLLAGCGARTPAANQPETTAPQQTQAPATEATVPETTEAATEEPTEAPTEPPVPFNPLNGEILDAPFDGRIYASTISNIPDALPHVNVVKADILMEMLVNNSIDRCLALFSDIGGIEAIGSTRSTRLMFNNITQHYNAILSHGGGSEMVISDANARGIAHYNVDSLMRQGDPLMKGTAYRDKEYKHGEHNLFVIGDGVKAYAESKGQQLTGNPEHDYGLRFVDDATPASGEDAKSISVTFTWENTKKETVMKYDESLNKYVFNQYGKEMRDQITDEPEAFQNVVIMHADIYKDWIYYNANFEKGGTGYYACGGKIIPINWACNGENEPFVFCDENWNPIPFTRGNTYIAICTPESPVVWTGEAE